MIYNLYEHHFSSKSKMNKKVMVSLILIGVVIVFLIFVGKHSDRTDCKIVNIEMYATDDSGEPILSSCISQDTEKINFELLYSSNFETTAKLVLLRNFKPINFRINNATVNEFNFIIDDTNGETFSISKKILLDSLDSKLNDMCMLLFIKDYIYTYRFQINNDFGNKNEPLKYKDTYKICKLPDTKVQFYSAISDNQNEAESELYAIDNNKKIFGVVNFLYELENTRFLEPFENRTQKEINYAIVEIVDDRFNNVLFYNSSKNYICFESDISKLHSLKKIKYIVFAYPNEFQLDYLKTYKAAMWSDPCVTYTLYSREKGENEKKSI